MGRLFQTRKTTGCAGCGEGAVELVAISHDDATTRWRCDECGHESVEETVLAVPEGQGTFFDRPI